MKSLEALRVAVVAGSLTLLGCGSGESPAPRWPKIKMEGSTKIIYRRNGSVERIFNADVPLVAVGYRFLAPSPDYSKFAGYNVSRNYYKYGGRIVVFDSSPVRARRVCVQGGGPVWSPDSTTLAYYHHGICVVSWNGLVHKRYTRTKFSPSLFVWSPDGKYLVYASGDTGLFSLSKDARAHIRLFEYHIIAFPCFSKWLTLNGKIGLLIGALVPERGEEVLRWRTLWVTPDGTQCKVIQPVGVRKRAVSNGPLPYRPCGIYGDGRFLGVDTPFRHGVIDLMKRVLIVVKEHSGNVVPSPDGKWIAYSTARGLTIVSADGRRKIRALNFRGTVVEWSRKGDWIYLYRRSLGGPGYLVAVDWRRKVRKYAVGISVWGPVFERSGEKLWAHCDVDKKHWGIAEPISGQIWRSNRTSCT